MAAVGEVPRRSCRSNSEVRMSAPCSRQRERGVPVFVHHRAARSDPSSSRVEEFPRIDRDSHSVRIDGKRPGVTPRTAEEAFDFHTRYPAPDRIHHSSQLVPRGVILYFRTVVALGREHDAVSTCHGTVRILPTPSIVAQSFAGASCPARIRPRSSNQARDVTWIPLS